MSLWINLFWLWLPLSVGEDLGHDQRKSFPKGYKYTMLLKSMVLANGEGNCWREYFMILWDSRTGRSLGPAPFYLPYLKIRNGLKMLTRLRLYLNWYPVSEWGPGFLLSWSRAAAGRFEDPQVGISWRLPRTMWMPEFLELKGWSGEKSKRVWNSERGAGEEETWAIMGEWKGKISVCQGTVYTV